VTNPKTPNPPPCIDFETRSDAPFIPNFSGIEFAELERVRLALYRDQRWLIESEMFKAMTGMEPLKNDAESRDRSVNRATELSRKLVPQRPAVVTVDGESYPLKDQPAITFTPRGRLVFADDADFFPAEPPEFKPISLSFEIKLDPENSAAMRDLIAHAKPGGGLYEKLPDGAPERPKPKNRKTRMAEWARKRKERKRRHG